MVPYYKAWSCRLFIILIYVKVCVRRYLCFLVIYSVYCTIHGIWHISHEQYLPLLPGKLMLQSLVIQAPALIKSQENYIVVKFYRQLLLNMKYVRLYIQQSRHNESSKTQPTLLPQTALSSFGKQVASSKRTQPRSTFGTAKRDAIEAQYNEWTARKF